jgi:hypothetical protein
MWGAESLVTNCLVTSNTALASGGGVYCAYGGTVERCQVFSNRSGSLVGGGVCLVGYGNLRNSLLIGNSSASGGGLNCTAGGTVQNCTIVGNSATTRGGGAYCVDGGVVQNTILYLNTAPSGANHTNSGAGWSYSHCCTTPLPSGIGHQTNAPLFADYAGGNPRLLADSPCINAGSNAFAASLTDLDGRARIVGGIVDIGAYECQPQVSGLFLGWLTRYGLATDGSADFSDPDADGHHNWQEWRCQTDPTNAISRLRLLSVAPSPTEVTVRWQSVAGVSYFLERSTDLSASPSFTWVAPSLPGELGTTTYSDTNAVSAPRRFYRVGVHSP